jgi:hypothetical protein
MMISANPTLWCADPLLADTAGPQLSQFLPPPPSKSTASSLMADAGVWIGLKTGHKLKASCYYTLLTTCTAIKNGLCTASLYHVILLAVSMYLEICDFLCSLQFVQRNSLTERTDATRNASSIKRGEKSFLFRTNIDQLPLQLLQQFVWAGSNWTRSFLFYTTSIKPSRSSTLTLISEFQCYVQ